MNVFEFDGGLSRGSGSCGRHHLVLDAGEASLMVRIPILDRTLVDLD